MIMSKTLPIALMSFDRPDYLEAVIQTLMRQRGYRGWSPQFFLFQDGVIAQSTGTRYGDPDKATEAVAVFRKYLPHGEVVISRFNLGVAHNFDRAERMFFLDNDFECAVFLEDDMLLQPHYMEVLTELLEMALANPFIGMVSAYGLRNDMPLDEQRRLAKSLCLMNEQNWAFGITRTCWQKRNHVVTRYLEILDEVEYRDRKVKHDDINNMMRSLGRGGKGYLSSQDSIKNMACEVSGIHRISTYTNNARYIGRKGLHMTEERFFARGYHRTVLYPDPHSGFTVPSPELLRKLRAI
jgi:hypothetical protein